MRTHSAPHPAARTQAASILCDWLTTEDFPDRALAASHPEHGMLTELVYGCVRRRLTLDWVIEQCTERPPKPIARALLYVGLYQLLYLDQVDDYAAVNETGEAAKQLKQARLVGLVNAVLRRVQRERTGLETSLASQPLWVRTSHPQFLVERWQEQHGESRTADLCAWNNQRPATSIRVMTSTISPDHLRASFEAAGIELQPHPRRTSDCFQLPRGIRIPDLPGFSDGWFVAQDPSTLSSVDLLDPQPGEAIFDLCASPGGKAAAIADRMRSMNAPFAGTLLAADLHSDRLPRLRENLDRLSLPEVIVEQADARSEAAVRELAHRQTETGNVDGVLLDVPCSNSGVIRRRPDARYRITRKRLQQMTRVQRSMLDAASTIVRPGGRLVYSTCSLEPEENQDQVESWLTLHPGFRREEEVRQFPPDTQSDGAYACKLIRQG